MTDEPKTPQEPEAAGSECSAGLSAAPKEPISPGPGWAPVRKAFTNGPDQIVGWIQIDPNNPEAEYWA